MNEGNRGLDHFFASLKPRNPPRFAVVRLALMVEYYPTQRQALRRLGKLKSYERMALVDRDTGITRCLKQHYPRVMVRLRKDGTAPAHFKRRGGVGYLIRKKPRSR